MILLVFLPLRALLGTAKGVKFSCYLFAESKQAVYKQAPQTRSRVPDYVFLCPESSSKFSSSSPLPRLTGFTRLDKLINLSYWCAACVPQMNNIRLLDCSRLGAQPTQKLFVKSAHRCFTKDARRASSLLHPNYARTSSYHNQNLPGLTTCCVQTRRK